MGLFDSLASALGIGNSQNSEDNKIVQQVLSGVGDQVAQAAKGTLGGYLPSVLGDLRSAQAGYDQQQKEKQDILRGAQDEYEQSQKPGVLSQAYSTALDKLKGGIHSAGLGIGSALGNKDLMNLAGAGATYFLTKDQRDEAERQQQEATNLAKQVAYLQDPEVAKIQDDAASKAYLSQALKGMSDRATMGLTPQDQADLEKIRNEQNQVFQSQQKQVQENMARRGMGNSGLALAQTMGASQASGQQAAQNATDLSSQMFQAKQNALGNLANTAGSALSGQFNRDTTRANATDQVSQFNTNQQTNANAAQRQQALNNVKFQQEAAKNKAQSLGNITQAGSTYLNSAFGNRK